MFRSMLAAAIAALGSHSSVGAPARRARNREHLGYMPFEYRRKDKLEAKRQGVPQWLRRYSMRYASLPHRPARSHTIRRIVAA